jgi:hypothetical protein
MATPYAPFPTMIFPTNVFDDVSTTLTMLVPVLEYTREPSVLTATPKLPPPAMFVTTVFVAALMTVRAPLRLFPT